MAQTWIDDSLGIEPKRRGRATRGTAPRLRRRVTLENGLVVDLFAGGGGASTGIRAAIGREPDIALNHDELALWVHEDNHPGTLHLPEDVWKTPPRKATKGRPVYILWASPDCFPAGTMVLTREGYAEIQNIQIGQEVLTHKGRWRRVTSTMSTMKQVRRIQGHGHPGIEVSGEHPFYIRKRTDTYEARKRVRVFGEPDWVPAMDLERGMLWASPVNFPAAVPPPVPKYGSRMTTITAELMWLAGLYVADGWTRLDEKHAELVITCGRHEASILRERLKAWQRAGARAGSDEFSWQERETETAHQFTTAHRGFVEWLREHFGHRAENKHIPGWALGMTVELRQALLGGYLSGDGWVSRDGELIEATTVSKALAFGLKALAGSLGKTVTVYSQANSCVILGRPVNARVAWKVRWRRQVDPAHQQTERVGPHEWAPIRRVEYLDGEQEVFNLSVDEDESYVADGIVVHNCTHFSAAKGGKPKQKNIRSLAHVVTRWAQDVLPSMIFVENVREFMDWGPLFDAGQMLDRDVTHGSGKARRTYVTGTVLGEDHPLCGHPIPWRKGETFRYWVTRLELLGYRVEWRVLDASSFGAPTKRRRLFIVARCDGEPITWPTVTHGKGDGLAPLNTAASCIDWSIPVPSIFGRKRPLAKKTEWRIAEGIRRFVLENPEPFIVGCGGRAAQTPPTPVSAPVGTVTAKNDRAVVVPTLEQVDSAFLATIDHQSKGDTSESIAGQLSTVTTKARHLLVSPSLVKVNHGGMTDRSEDVNAPLSTVTAQQRGHALVTADMAPLLVQTGYGEREGQAARVLDLHEPLGTVMATGQKHALVSAVLEESHQEEVAAFLAKHFGGVVGVPLDGRPMDTVTAKDHHSLVTSTLVKLRGECSGADIQEPMPTITAGGNHVAEVRAFLTTYYSSGSQWADMNKPMPTITALHRLGIVVVKGTAYQIVDIGMRMLEPHELLAAQFGRFAKDYKLGRAKTKRDKVRLIGNSVAPECAEAVVRANCGKVGAGRMAA